MKRRTSLAVGLWLTAAASASAQPVETFEHRGSLGLVVSAGGEYAFAASTKLTDNGPRVPLEIGATVSVTEHTELMLSGRLGPPGPYFDTAAFFGLRNSRGERFKTFFDLELAAHFTPLWAIGGRVGFGVQYEFLPVLGAFAVANIQGGGGAGLRLSFEVLLGLQFRTYVLPL